MTFREVVVDQFQRPRGPLGWIVGRIMANRPSNRARNLWTIDHLDIRPGARVLEIGCGPGFALETCARKLETGRVTGLDHSQTMLDQAARRNREAIAAGTVALVHGSVGDLAELDGPFDRVFAVNVVQFLPDRQAAFRDLFRITAPGGRIAMTYQPRNKNPTRADALRVADAVRADLEAAGYALLRVEELPLDPVPALCVLGERMA